MKGILLAGGYGTRLYPITLATSKHLLPVYDKPMIYYSLSTLMVAGIWDIMLISTPEHIPQFQKLLGNGNQYGIKISYAEQPKPNGIAEAFIISAEWLAGGPCALMLGDNLIFGNGFPSLLQKAVRSIEDGGGARIFTYHVPDPERYGVVFYTDDGSLSHIIEKPSLALLKSQNSKTNDAVIGLYFYDKWVTQIARSIRPSGRGELEITDINNIYIKSGSMGIEPLRRGYAWFDAGTPDSLLQASNFVQNTQKRTIRRRHGVFSHVGYPGGL